MKDSPKQQIAFFEEEVKDILGKPPQYLVRWGISLYLLLFCLILFLSVTIDYPIYTSCEAEITPLNQAQFVVLDEMDVINNLQVQDGTQIDKGNILYSTKTESIKANTDGELRFLKPISQGYTSSSTDTILQINPALQDYKLLIKVPSQYINQIKIDQKISFRVDSKIIDGIINTIPSNPASDGNYYVEAGSESNQTYISSANLIAVDILIDNKKIFHKILNL